MHYFKELELHAIELKKFTDKLGGEGLGFKIQSGLDVWSKFLIKHDLIGKAQLSHSLDDVPVKAKESNKIKGEFKEIENSLDKESQKQQDRGGMER